jgi:hypothetical protein
MLLWESLRPQERKEISTVIFYSLSFHSDSSLLRSSKERHPIRQSFPTNTCTSFLPKFLICALGHR